MCARMMLPIYMPQHFPPRHCFRIVFAFDLLRFPFPKTSRRISRWKMWEIEGGKMVENKQ